MRRGDCIGRAVPVRRHDIAWMRWFELIKTLRFQFVA
jgi:hypothetical protein